MSKHRVAALAALAVIVACAKPLSEEKRAWVGEWKNDHARLLITADGRLEWERKSGGVTTSVSGPIQALDDTRIVAGVWVLRSTFAVSEPPGQREDGIWSMVVDGERLLKADALGRDPRATKVPPLDDLRHLVGADLRRLGRGILAADFTEFRDGASQVLQSQFTAEKLKESYQAFVDRKIPLERFLAGDAVLTAEPSISPQGELEVKGRYPPVEGAVLVFEASYLFGQGEWRAAGMSVSMRPE